MKQGVNGSLEHEPMVYQYLPGRFATIGATPFSLKYIQYLDEKLETV